VGIQLFSYIAGVALLVAAVAFLRYSIQNGWLGPAVRMAIGLLAGTALLAVCESRRARAYAVTAQALTAAGIATLFSTFYASAALWRLLPAWAAFLLMALAAAVAVALSIRRDSVFIALLGLVGGFATPMLLSTGENRPFALFGYLALLNAGLGWVAYRKRWPLLSALTLGFTALYQLGWVAAFLGEASLAIGFGVFLLFPVLAFGGFLLWQALAEEELPALFRRTTALSALPALLFALHVAATPAYGQHYGLMFGFLFLVAAGLAAVALFHGPEWLHALGAAGVLVVTGAWAAGSYTSQAWPAILGFLGLFAGLYLAVPWLQSRLARKLPFEGPGLLAVYAAPLLLLLAPALVFLEPATAAPGPLFGALFLVMVLIAGYAVRFEDGRAHFLACGIALATEAAWSWRWLDARRLLPALLVYAGFALFYLGVPWWAERRGRPLRPRGGGAILALAALGLLAFLAVGPVAHASLGALALMLALLNAGLLHEAGRGRLPFLCLLGALGSWILMALWCAAALAVDTLLPALAVLAAFGVMLAAGRAWLQGRGAAGPDPAEAALALAGHLFILRVALRPGLAFPPWPWLGALLVLDLALAGAALYRKRDSALAGAALLTQLILIGWAGTGVHPGQLDAVAPWAGLAFAGLGLAWFELGRRRPGLDRQAGLGLLGAQGLMLALHLAIPQAFAPLLAVHLMLAMGLLTLAWRSRRHGWAVALAWASGLVLLLGPVLPAAAAGRQLLAVGGALYLLQLAYPLALGARARDERLPFLSALVASGLFFLLARPVLVRLGFGAVIGALPVLQAVLLVPHLVRLLRLQPAGGRELRRLAMVAGGMLALITVAIPLQLDREWITLGWALLGAALAWLFGRVPHRGLVLWAAGLFTAVFARLALNPAVLDYHPRSPVPVWNWYLYTYLLAAGCCFGAAWLLRGRDDRLPWGLPPLSRLLPAAGAALLFLLLNLEIADGFSTGPALTFNLLHGSLAQDLSYTIGWALFAILMLAAGIIARNRMTRVAAILLLTVTVLKAFLHDLGALAGLYRVASFVGLALCLALVAVVLQKFALRRGGEAP